MEHKHKTVALPTFLASKRTAKELEILFQNNALMEVDQPGDFVDGNKILGGRQDKIYYYEDNYFVRVEHAFQTDQFAWFKYEPVKEGAIGLASAFNTPTTEPERSL